MSERRCDWHGEVDHEAIGKRIADAVREPQEGASRNAVPVNDAGQIHDPGDAPSCDSELAAIRAEWNDRDSPLHGPEGCSFVGTLLRMVDELTYQLAEEKSEHQLTSEQRDSALAKLAVAEALAAKNDARAKLLLADREAAEARVRWLEEHECASDCIAWSLSSTKRLSPERIAEITRLAIRSESILPCELLGHIEALEAELKTAQEAFRVTNLGYEKELAEAKAEIGCQTDRSALPDEVCVR